MKKVSSKNWIKLILFSFLAGIAIAGVYHVLSWKDTMGPHLSNVQQLYATEDKKIDVFFVGSSHVYGGINPDVLWQQRGIASFDLACSGQDKQSAVRFLKEALKTQSPKVVFVDIFSATYEKGAVQGNVYRNMLSMDLSPNSVGLVHDYFEKYDMDYILKWPIVHTRYRELEPYDFVQFPFSEYGRGFCSRYSIGTIDPGIEAGLAGDAVPISETNKTFVDDLVILAEEQGFSLVLMILPYQMKAEDQVIYNGIFEYAAAKGIECLNFNASSGSAYAPAIDTGLDYTADFMDHGHLNIFGAEKLSTWLGTYLAERYDLADHRGDPSYRMWDESAAYQGHLALWEMLPVTGDPVSYASAIGAIQDVETILTVPAQGLPGDISDGVLHALDILGAPQELAQSGGTCIVKNREVLAYLDNTDKQKNASISLDLDCFHTIHAEKTADGEQIVLFDRERIFLELNGLGILVYDPVLGEKLDMRFFE